MHIFKEKIIILYKISDNNDISNTTLKAIHVVIPPLTLFSSLK